MKILHIFKNTNEKFSEPFIELINTNFEISLNRFLILGKDNRTNKIQRDNVHYVKNRITAELLTNLHFADKIILHSLTSPFLIGILFLQPWLLKKCYWVIWGSDLYYYKNRAKGLRSDFYEFLRKFTIKRMRGFITHIKGDYQLAKSWYNAKGVHYYSFIYPSNLYNELDLSTAVKTEESIFIQVGNSADPSNNSIEILKNLAAYKDNDIKIICPLSYGDLNYKEKVIKVGKRLFGEKFIPITNFLPFEEYLKLLGNIDIAIFNHNRQQALGNIITLLGLKKKVYIRKEITTWGFCKDHGLKVYEISDQFSDLFKPMLEEDLERNQKKLKEHFTEEKLLNDWDRIFKS